MTRHQILLPLGVLIVMVVFNLFVSICECADGEIMPEEFAGDDGLLDESELVNFLLVFHGFRFDDVWGVSVSDDAIAAQNGNVLEAKKKVQVDQDLIELNDEIGTSPPYTVSQIRDYFKLKKSADGKEPKWPIKSTDERWVIHKPQLRNTYFEWEKNPSDNVDLPSGKKGAVITYSENRLEDKETWVTQGSVIFPAVFKIDDLKYFNYIDLALIPNIYWNYIKIDSEDNSDTEKLTFRLPFFTAFSHRVTPNVLKSWRGDLYLSPLYSTDFDFKGEIVGADLSYEPMFDIGDGFKVGAWGGISENWDMAYLIRIIPGISYNQVLSESEFINREENEETFGVTLGLELGIAPFGKKTPWRLTVNYDMLYDFKEETDEYFDRWKGALTYWVNRSIGLTFAYERGDMFLERTEIDLMTLGLELLY